MATPVKPQRRISRLSEIGRVATRHGFGYLIDRRRSNDNRQLADRGRRLREMLDELGPTFVKFGQLLSTRPDVMPPDIIAELRKLQDQVSPIPFEDVRRVVEEELELTIEQAFVSFDEQPVAAASIGQVHCADLPTGGDVVVKVQRPDAPRQIESDLQLMRSAARVVRERVRSLDFIDSEALVDEFARSIRQELDYQHEARNAETFRRNFGDSTEVAVPRVIWRYSSARVLTLERLEGKQFADIDLATYSPEQRRELAYRMTDAWMTMIFRHGFFHGDPHPANIMLLDDGRIGLVDFGLAGKLTDEDMTRLTRLFVDAATENVDALPRRLSELGLRYPKEREQELRGRDRGALLPLLRRERLEHRPDRGDPRGPRPHLLAQPAPADAVRDPRQGDRDARRGGRRALSRLQRLRGGEAVRAQADGGAVLAEADVAADAERGARARLRRARAALPDARHRRADAPGPARGADPQPRHRRADLAHRPRHQPHRDRADRRGWPRRVVDPGRGQREEGRS